MKKDKNNDKNKNKVYKNETKNKEAELVNMYSCKDSDKEVDIRLKILRICYGGISAFLDQDHIKIGAGWIGTGPYQNCGRVVF